VEKPGMRRYLLNRDCPRHPDFGRAGALLATREAMELIPAFPVTAQDSTGAGDAFIGSFAVFLAEGLSRARSHRAPISTPLSPPPPSAPRSPSSSGSASTGNMTRARVA
jgi:ribokinase